MLGRFDSMLFRLIPGRCVVCSGKTGRQLDICPGCQRDMPKMLNPCWQCGLPIEDRKDSCIECIKQPPIFSHCFTAFSYASPIDNLINRFKNQRNLAIGQTLGILLARGYVSNHRSFPDCWLPVPLHPSAFRKRGFNQALELGYCIAATTGKPLLGAAIRRDRNTSEQKHLSKADRLKNMRLAFSTKVDFTGLKVGIIDDVITTGATTSAIAETLLEAGADDVEVVAVARTPPT